MASNEPLPCPFCGAPPAIKRWTGRDKRNQVTIFCRNPLCYSGPGVIARTKEIALDYWNTRYGKR